MDDADRIRLAARAALSNPFEDERDVLDFALLGRARGTLSPDVVLAGLTETMEHVIARCRHNSAGLPLAESAPQDLRLATLFNLFHQALPEMDAHVTREACGESKPKPAFAYALLTSLEEHGAPPLKAAHFVSLFYQMRRAFLHVSRLLPGEGPSMQRLRANVWNAIFTARLDLLENGLPERLRDFPMLLTGETGTGKSSAARAIGLSCYVSFDPARGFALPSSELFVPVNIGSLTESLFEAEIFGARKGAYTGATEDRAGLLAQCKSHSTLFLDEVGELPDRLQVKLLGVLQERTFRALGETHEKAFVGRVIAATHRDPLALVASGRMREDFYFRLCVGTIAMPALRKRLAESGLALGQLVGDTLTRSLGRPPEASLLEDALDAFEKSLPRDYAWPGNVRELEQRARGFLLTGKVTAPPSEPRASERSDKYGASLGRSALHELVAEVATHDPTIEEISSALARIYHASEGSLEKAARKAGVDWRTLKRLLKVPF